ncbi:MAG: thiosulfate oxidation carrier complex protein SoxZ [Alphaproteobacteria bacterium]|nr:thiosulfate oxidation carrier complex protein SoxZ [Alphaproteobacteria bacterium]
MTRVLIRVPKTVKPGQEFEIKVLISHPMETGYRRDHQGTPIPRDIVKQFRCTLDGEEVFRAEMFPAIAANPYFFFHAVAERGGTLRFEWSDERGTAWRESAALTVE